MIIPILKLENILLSSLQGNLTDHDVLNFQNDILQKVKDSGADGVIIDLMGLDLVDSFMVRVINETANMIRLLGSEIIICGMHPAIALTLSEMGSDLVAAHTSLNLDFALEKMRNKLETIDVTTDKNSPNNRNGSQDKIENIESKNAIETPISPSPEKDQLWANK